MNLEEVKAKMKEIEKTAAEHPEKRATLRLKYRPLQAALRIYYKNHPQDKLV